MAEARGRSARGSWFAKTGTVSKNLTRSSNSSLWPGIWDFLGLVVAVFRWRGGGVESFARVRVQGPGRKGLGFRGWEVGLGIGRASPSHAQLQNQKRGNLGFRARRSLVMRWPRGCDIAACARKWARAPPGRSRSHLNHRGVGPWLREVKARSGPQRDVAGQPGGLPPCGGGLLKVSLAESYMRSSLN